MTPVIHIAAVPVKVGCRLRQRCGWCGAMICDFALLCQNPEPPTWEHGKLIAVDGNASWVVEHEDGADLPEGACGLLDPEVTV